jgi:hypothetical protein
LQNDNKTSISELLAKRKYNPLYKPDKENNVFTIDNKHVGSLQNFVTFSGLPKAGKSTFIAAIISSAFNTYDIFTMKLSLPSERRKICYFDTESSDYDFYRQINKIKYFADKEHLPEWFNAYQVREDSSNVIRKMIDIYLSENLDCSVLIIDGLLDLVTNVNDEKESSLVTKWLKKITKVYNILVITVLHQSKSNLTTTGHLGSASDRFAQSTLEITKNKENNSYVLSSKFMRSDTDFMPITLINVNGSFIQTDSEKPTNTKNKKASELDEIESHRICKWVILSPLFYDEIINEIIERQAVNKVYAKHLIKIWITKGWIIKNKENKYIVK